MPTLTAYSNHDAYTYEANPENAFNEGPKVGDLFQSGTGDRLYGWANYNLSGLPTGVVVSSATAYLWYDEIGGDQGGAISTWGGFTLYVKAAAASWAQSTITWSNQPGVGTSGGSAVTPAARDAWMAWNITAIAAEWAANTANRLGLRWDAAVADGTFGNGRSWEFYGLEIGGGVHPYVTITYDNPPTQPGAFSSPTAGQVVNASVVATTPVSTDLDGDAITYEDAYSTNNGSSWTSLGTAAGTVDGGNVSRTHDSTAWASSAAAKLRRRAVANGLTSAWRESSVFTVQHNQAPNPDTPLTPIGGAVIDRDIDNVFQVQFNDPDAGDTPSARNWRYRLVGAPGWTETGYVVGTTNQRTFVAGTFAAGNYEWQSRPKDSQGVEATSWSESEFFTAASAPTAPEITSPLDGATIVTSTGVIAWSAPTHSHFQARKVADDAPAPDTSTIYYDSGQVPSATARDHALTYPENNRWEHLQVRIKAGGLWSEWASVRVQVSYTPPAVPTVTVTVHEVDGRQAALAVSATHPEPEGTEPTVTSMDVHRRVVGDTGDGIQLRELTDLAPTATGIDWAVASVNDDGDPDYEHRVEAHGDNGTSTFSAWVGAAAPPPPPPDYYGGGYE